VACSPPRGDGDECVLVGIGTGVCVEGVCALGGCGNGALDVGEACDDGNRRSGDGCRADCGKVEACGDAVVDEGEACDDGNGNPADRCDACRASAWQAVAHLAGAGAATEVGLALPRGVAVDRAGNVFIADTGGHRIHQVGADGTIVTRAGTGRAGFQGDGGPATAAELNGPSAVAVDGVGNLYVLDAGNARVRLVRSDGVIATIAGDGTSGGSGDGGPAVLAQLAPGSGGGLAVDGLGEVYVADTFNHRIRRVGRDGVITTVAGSGTVGSSGDGGPATEAQLTFPAAVALDPAGAVLIGDGSNRVRRVDASGTITTVAGNGQLGHDGDGGLAIAAQLGQPQAIALDAGGAMYITTQNLLRRVSPDGIIARVAGQSGVLGGFAGDGGPALAAQFDGANGVAVAGDGVIYVADTSNNRVRRIAVNGVIATAAGSGVGGAGGAGGGATSATLAAPHGIAVDGDGNLYIAETYNHVVQRVRPGGEIAIIAGTGLGSFGGDGGPAVAAQLAFPHDVAVDAAGAVFILDNENCRIRRVDPDGTITTIAGTGSCGYDGDGGPATAAELSYPEGLALDGAGNLYIADTGNVRVRRVNAAGTISTVAGDGSSGFGGDGGPAIEAQFAAPRGLVVDGAGNLYIADTGNRRVRKVSAAGTVTTIAGTGASGAAGDGGPATAAQLALPVALALDAAGRLYIADDGSNRVRRVSAAGTISTYVGVGLAGFGGDGGAAAAALLDGPRGLALDAAGDLYISERDNARVRRVDAGDHRITTVAGQVDPPGGGPVEAARLADPQALVRAPPYTLIAAGVAGVVQLIRAAEVTLETVIGRYPHAAATAALARFRDETFGTVGGVAFDAAAGPHGVIYLSETSAGRLHAVTIVDPDDVATWSIARVGAGAPGFADGPLAGAQFAAPAGLLLDAPTRTLYVADAGNHAVRAIDLDAGTVATVAGTPATRGFYGDDLAATAALLYAPTALALAPSGDLFIADTGNHRVRRVEAGTGVITTVLGDGVAASSGEGSPAWTFPVHAPRGLAVDELGNLFVTSSTAVRLLPASPDQRVDGTGRCSRSMEPLRATRSPPSRPAA
jgi:cysteine-rich repeat protein